MESLKNFVAGQWVAGQGAGTTLGAGEPGMVTPPSKATVWARL